MTSDFVSKNYNLWVSRLKRKTRKIYVKINNCGIYFNLDNLLIYMYIVKFIIYIIVRENIRLKAKK